MFFDRANRNLHVHDYRENGDITTPFDMRVMNQMDRFDLVKEVVSSLPDASRHAALISEMDGMLQKHHAYIREEGTDLPEIENWQWQALK